MLIYWHHDSTARCHVLCTLSCVYFILEKRDSGTRQRITPAVLQRRRQSTTTCHHVEYLQLCMHIFIFVMHISDPLSRLSDDWLSDCLTAHRQVADRLTPRVYSQPDAVSFSWLTSSVCHIKQTLVRLSDYQTCKTLSDLSASSKWPESSYERAQ